MHRLLAVSASQVPVLLNPVLRARRPYPGDGTVLWTCHIFGNQSVPPVIPFNMGSLGFLTPFDPADALGVLQHVMEGEQGRTGLCWW